MRRSSAASNLPLSSRSLLGFAVASVAPVAAQCATQWLPGAGVPGVKGAVYATASWDPDGPGPATPCVVVGGSFPLVTDVVAKNIAAYDPANGRWTALGSDLEGEVDCILALPTGELFAAGSRVVAATSVAQVVRWNGTTWDPVGTLPTGVGSSWVTELGVLPNGDLVAAGLLLGGPQTPLLRWNGVTWSPLGVFPGFSVPPTPQFPSGFFFPDRIASLAILGNGDLVVSGSFTSVSGVAASHIARWDGATWSPLATGLPLPADALLSLPNGGLAAGGAFTSAGGIPANHVAQWNGTNWNSIGAGTPERATSLAIAANGDLLVSDEQSVPPYNSPAGNVHRWNGVSWNPLLTARVDSFIDTLLALPSGELVVGGGFRRIDGRAASSLAHWDGAVWHPYGAGNDGRAIAFAVAFDGDLLAAGDFRTIGGVAAEGVARWNGAAWAPLGGSYTSGSIAAIAGLPNGDVVVGGLFDSIGGVAANNIARWDGSAWHPLGSGTQSVVRCLAAMPNGDLVVSGDFSSAGGVAANRIARWNGASWGALPNLSGVGTAVFAMRTTPGGDVIVGGLFATAGGIPVNGIARWNGTTWSALGTGTGAPWDQCESLAVLPNGDVVAASSMGAVVRRWTGATWTALPPGPAGPVGAMSSLANGDLIVAARSVADGTLARWDGTTWTTLGTSCDGWVGALETASDGSLCASGFFAQAGGQVSAHFARWGTTCPANVSPHGLGCSGAAGLGVLISRTVPWNGTAFRSRATGMADGLAVAAYGFTTTSVPWPSLHPAGSVGCDLLVTPDIVLSAIPNAGVIDVSITIAPAPSLVGATFHHQVHSIEIGSLQQIVAITSTNALSLVVGSY